MLIQRTLVSVTYKRINNIEKIYYNNKDILRRYFDQATILPVPENAPAEIPRIIVKTLHGHAQLNISSTAATFEIYYNEGFEQNWGACIQYIRGRMTKVFDFLNILTDHCYEYIGVVCDIIYDEIKQNGAEKIVTTLLDSKKIRDIYDINIKYTFVEQDNIFVNIMLQNARLFKTDNMVSHAGELSNKNQISESIGITIDINDRYGFNNNPEYCSNKGMLEKLLDTMNNIIENKLCSLIENGVY